MQRTVQARSTTRDHQVQHKFNPGRFDRSRLAGDRVSGRPNVSSRDGQRQETQPAVCITEGLLIRLSMPYCGRQVGTRNLAPNNTQPVGVSGASSLLIPDQHGSDCHCQCKSIHAGIRTLSSRQTLSWLPLMEPKTLVQGSRSELRRHSQPLLSLCLRTMDTTVILPRYKAPPSACPGPLLSLLDSTNR